MPTDINKAFERFQKENLEDYKGKWIALSAELGIVAADKNLKIAEEEFKKKLPDKEPFVFKVPEKMGLVVYGGIYIRKTR